MYAGYRLSVTKIHGKSAKPPLNHFVKRKSMHDSGDYPILGPANACQKEGLGNVTPHKPKVWAVSWAPCNNVVKSISMETPILTSHDIFLHTRPTWIQGY